MRHAWLGAMVLGLMPAMASAGHHHDSFRFSVGFGGGYGYRDYGYCDYGCRDYGYRSYSRVYVEPPVVYVPPPVVYVQPAPAVIYDAPVVCDPGPGVSYYRSYQTGPTYETYRSGPTYTYRETHYYYGR